MQKSFGSSVNRLKLSIEHRRHKQDMSEVLRKNMNGSGDKAITPPQTPEIPTKFEKLRGYNLGGVVFLLGIIFISLGAMLGPTWYGDEDYTISENTKWILILMGTLLGLGGMARGLGRATWPMWEMIVERNVFRNRKGEHQAPRSLVLWTKIVYGQSKGGYLLARRLCQNCDNEVAVTEILNSQRHEVLKVSNSTRTTSSTNPVVGITSVGGNLGIGLGGVRSTSQIPVKVGIVEITVSCPTCKSYFVWTQELEVVEWTDQEGRISYEVVGKGNLP